MSELFDDVLEIFEYFNNGDYLFFTIFIISVIYIFITEKDKKLKNFFVWYSVLILIIILNPICFKILNEFINYGAMYRIYYMLPLSITIAYTFTKIIERLKKWWQKVIVLIIVILGIMYFGDFLIDDSVSIKTNNLYKLPDEEVQIAEIIYQDSETDYKRAIVPYGMSSHIRQIHSEIELIYTRVVTSAKDENGNQLPHDTDDASNYEPVQKLLEGDAEYIVDFCINNSINYIVISKSTELTWSADEMATYGFEIYSETENYVIYKNVEFSK